MGPHLCAPLTCLLSPGLGMWGRGFFTGFSKGPRQSSKQLSASAPQDSHLVTGRSHRGQLPAHPEAAHSERQTQGLPWQSSGENSVVPMQEARVQSPARELRSCVPCTATKTLKNFFLKKLQDRHTGWQIHQNTPEIHQQTHACCHSSDTDHTQNRTTHTSTERHIC